MGHLTSTTTTLVYDNLNNNVKPMTKDCLDQSINGINDSSINNNNNSNHLSKICIQDRDDSDDNIGDSKICDNTENKVGNGEVNADKEEGYTYFGFIKVNAKLKWDNIIGIVIIHTLFVYSFLHWRNIPTHIMTYVWGKSLLLLLSF